MPIETDPLLTPDGHVAGDLLCGNCGYNLRTLSATGRCPECGAEVSEAVRRAYIDTGEWVETATGGLSMLTVAFATTCLGAVFSLLHPAPTAACFVAAALCALLGVFTLAAPMPAGIRPERRFSIRRLIRLSYLVAFLGVVGLIFVSGLLPTTPNTFISVVLVGIAVVGIFMPVFAVPILLAVHVGTMLKYLRRPEDVGVAAFVAIFGVVAGLAGLLTVTGAIQISHSDILLLLWVFLAAYLLAWAYLLWRLGRALHAAAKQGWNRRRLLP